MYEFNVTLKLSFDDAMTKVIETMKQEHLGIVSDVNVQAIVKNKLEKDIPAYRILGACNPILADRAIGAEPNVGTLLPCNLILRQAEDGVVVSFMDPLAVLGLAENAEVQAVAEEARTKLDRVMTALQA